MPGGPHSPQWTSRSWERRFREMDYPITEHSRVGDTTPLHEHRRRSDPQPVDPVLRRPEPARTRQGGTKFDTTTHGVHRRATDDKVPIRHKRKTDP